ncbi:unannotated protein [freshwater metagenome]|uniref:Unannotated protein n=1 Tax=freshwater metagenome TaxID=449393 RepID=A0A6J5YDC7_9ZZZZ
MLATAPISPCRHAGRAGSLWCIAEATTTVVPGDYFDSLLAALNRANDDLSNVPTYYVAK